MLFPYLFFHVAEVHILCVLFQVAYSQLLSERVSSSLVSAFRESSNRQWQYAWKKFQKYLTDNQVREVTKSTTLKFLDHTFKSSQLSPKTLQVYKGALSLPLKTAFNIDTGDEEFALLIRSFFISRPPIKKAPPRWSLDALLKFLTNSTDESDLFLLQKTLFLVALATGNRASEISAMTRTSVVFEDNPARVFVPVKPNFLFKNQRMNRAPPNIVIRALNSNGSEHPLCPMNFLKKYLTRTNFPNASQALFHSLRGSPLKASDVSLQLCRLIEAACPGSVPKGHDVRKVGASLAWCRGLSPSEIIQRAFWSSSNVFVSRYLKEVENEVQCVALGTTM